MLNACGAMVYMFLSIIYLLVIVQMVFSALAFAQSEVLWYFQHVGVASSKSKTARVVPVETVRKISFNCIFVMG